MKRLSSSGTIKQSFYSKVDLTEGASTGKVRCIQTSAGKCFFALGTRGTDYYFTFLLDAGQDANFPAPKFAVPYCSIAVNELPAECDSGGVSLYPNGKLKAADVKGCERPGGPGTPLICINQ
ncbi:MAG: hypothetical protein JO121_14960 [Deltaproteobacteria bacterium]|nr:hypothetical protein [Deltaproteobacteria bacterium]